MSAKRPPSTRIRVSAKGWEAFCIAAELDYGVEGRELLEALMNFALSQHYRPGSWEAQGFDFRNYRDGGFADEWFAPIQQRKL